LRHKHCMCRTRAYPNLIYFSNLKNHSNYFDAKISDSLILFNIQNSNTKYLNSMKHTNLSSILIMEPKYFLKLSSKVILI
jgi:hypothetical protein